jgi:hypothetical protein
VGHGLRHSTGFGSIVAGNIPPWGSRVGIIWPCCTVTFSIRITSGPQLFRCGKRPWQRLDITSVPLERDKLYLCPKIRR